ncbi:hypothetical protein EYF80_053235 [Liparis tanakae]|uniref:Uncharacterized protein n=1 Tax=Liparis tanakae TaxID=230148 RepID=A0A4Z2F725_9TELE|nr:hypothetical protein EYF80_053235 [Liparis tanakae]
MKQVERKSHKVKSPAAKCLLRCVRLRSTDRPPLCPFIEFIADKMARVTAFLQKHMGDFTKTMSIFDTVSEQHAWECITI